MADNWWTDTDNDDDDYGNNDANKAKLPEPARQHMRKLEKQLKTVMEENNALKASQRKTTVSDLVKAKGYNPAIASFVPSDIEVTDEAVGKWLESHGELFAKPKIEETGTSNAGDAGSIEPSAGVAIPPELMEALGLVSTVSSGAVTPTKPADLAQQMANAPDQAAFMKILRDNGAQV
jgi:hypothetical protein